MTGLGETSRNAGAIVKRSLMIAGHATSISLEAPFWEALKALARERGVSVAMLAAETDRSREGANLSSALRVLVLHALQDKLALQAIGRKAQQNEAQENDAQEIEARDGDPTGEGLSLRAPVAGRAERESD